MNQEVYGRSQKISERLKRGHDIIMDNEIVQRFRMMGERLRKEYHADRVILFGSYAMGTATVDSDVDLLVIASTNERFFDRMASVRRLLRHLRNGLPVSPIILTPEEIDLRKKVGDPFIIEILEKGIML